MNNKLLLGVLLCVAVLAISVISFRVAGFSSAKTTPIATNDETITPETVPADEKSSSKTGAAKTVIVELFTSEGCSSCPPADYVLSRLEESQPIAGVEVITLGQHVDYWDSLGWKDSFSSAATSARQNQYANAFKADQVYTPQMVVDGNAEFVGSNMQKAQTAIMEAAKQSKAAVEIAFADSGDKNKSTLNIKIDDLPKRTENVEIFLAITENNLVSSVSRGENSGKELKHNSVVRELRTIASLTADQKSFSGQTSIQLPANWKPKNLRAVVFVQEAATRKIIGAARINFN